MSIYPASHEVDSRIVRELEQLSHKQIVRLAALGVLFTLFSVIILLSKGYLVDPDIWWHLKVGDWIVQHRSVPSVGILSRTAATRPWVAYSWGFEVILSRVYAWLGLMGFAYFGILLSVLVSIVLFATCFALSRRFWQSWLLTLLGTFAYVYSVFPRPVFLSMMLFNVMLYLLLKAQRSGRIQDLYCFPVLFLLWANLHIQFIYGLATLGLYVVATAAVRLASGLSLNVSTWRTSSLSLFRLSVILAASAAASCVGPYSYRLFAVVIGYSRATQTYSVIQELLSPSFDSLTSFVFLFVIMAAFYAAGSRKQIDLFQLSLMVIASLCAFRTVRDAWFAAIPAILLLADGPVELTDRDPAFTHWQLLSLTGSTAVLVFLLATNTGFTTRGVDYCVSMEFPVDAANFLRRIEPPGPIYNDFDWGGFLTWYLPQYPVSIDGRNDLYGDKFVADYLIFNSGDRTDGNPPLDEAGIVLLKKDAQLAQLLKHDSRFRFVYEDRLADVFLRN
jgi:hypothetical protein